MENIFKSVVFSVALGFAGGVSEAKTSTWIGPVGGDGRWSVASNWEGGALPEDGDTLVFASGSAATNDIGDIELAGVVFRSGSKFEIGGSGKLVFLGGSVVSNDASVAEVAILSPVELRGGAHTSTVDNVWFKSAFSGSGDLVHTGAYLSFTKNMPNYSGSIFATNATIYPHREHTYDHNAALGKNNVVHAKRFSIEGNGTWFDKSNTNYFHLANSTPSYQTLKNYCGDVKMSGPVYFLEHARICGNGIKFEGSVYGATQLTFDAGSTSTEVVFGNIVSNGSTISVSTSSVLRFRNSGNDYAEGKLNEMGGKMVFEEEDE